MPNKNIPYFFLMTALLSFFVFVKVAPAQTLSDEELIVNGDFSGGGVGFRSEYAYTDNNLIMPGKYTVLPNPQLAYNEFNPCADHTSGDGNMMIVNGSEKEDLTIWAQTVTRITPNTDYRFQIWFCSVMNLSPAVIDIFINNDKLNPSPIYLSYTPCIWTQFIIDWNSSVSDTAEIRIVNLNTDFFGNDFAIDDVSLKPYCSLKANAGDDKIICEGETSSIGRPAALGRPPYSYSWSPAAGLSAADVPNPEVDINAATTYQLTVIDDYNCIAYDTVTVTVIHYPDAKITLNKSHIICPCDSVTLSVISGYSYSWSTGASTQSITVKDAGRYSVTVYTDMLCPSTADTVVKIINTETTVRIDSLRVKIGERTLLPIRITSDFDSSKCVSFNYYARISYNKSMLLPWGDTPFGTTVGTKEVIEIDGFSMKTLLDSLEFIAALGSAECTDVSLELFEWSCGDIEVNTYNGRVCLDGICPEPTLRLFDGDRRLYLTRNVPNPVYDKTKIKFGIIERGYTTLQIVNIYGEIAATPFEGVIAPGEYEIEFDASETPSGAFFYILKTPSDVLHRRMLIIR